MIAQESDIVDVMVSIMDGDDGLSPRPRSQKRRNAAEQFLEYHKAELNSIRQSGNRIGRVHQHNQATPCLDDELAKRRSTTRITTIKAERVIEGFDPDCIACARIATFNELRKLNLKPKCKNNVADTKSKYCVKSSNGSGTRRRRTRRSRDRRYRNRNPNDNKRTQDKLVGVNKSKSKTRSTASKSLYRVSKIWINESCQCSVSSVNRCPSTRTLASRKTMTTAPDDTVNVNATPQRTCEACEPSETVNRSTRDPSVSSYESYLSIDHEPMDANS